jgi:hypothetical protein
LDLRQQKSVTEIADIYNERFEKLLLSVDEAIIDAGMKTDKQQKIDASEQQNSRRLLLVVEELANKKKEVAATAEQAFMQQVEADFHDSLVADLELEFTDTPMIMEKILRFDESLGRLLDILYTESCSISRLVTCLETLPWLQDAVLKFVKQPKYRRLDSSGHPILLKTIRSALSFIGIESLRTLLPVLIAKHTNPGQSEFTPNIVKNMWIYTIGTGNIAKALAEKFGVKAHFGHNIGLFCNIGRTAVVNLYLRAFENKLREEIIKARKENNINQAKALSILTPSQKFIVGLCRRHANKITANVIKNLHFRWLMIAGGLEDFAKIRKNNIHHVESLDVLPLAKLLFISQGFMQYKMLYAEKLMGKQEAMVYLRNFGVTSKDIAILSKINLTAIELNIAGVIDQSDENNN